MGFGTFAGLLVKNTVVGTGKVAIGLAKPIGLGAVDFVMAVGVESLVDGIKAKMNTMELPEGGRYALKYGDEYVMVPSVSAGKESMEKGIKEALGYTKGLFKDSFPTKFEVVALTADQVTALKERKIIEVRIEGSDHYGEVHCFNCDAVLGYSEDRPESPQFCGKCSGENDCTTCGSAQECYDSEGSFVCIHTPERDGEYLSGPMGDNHNA